MQDWMRILLGYQGPRLWRETTRYGTGVNRVLLIKRRIERVEISFQSRNKWLSRLLRKDDGYGDVGWDIKRHGSSL